MGLGEPYRVVSFARKEKEHLNLGNQLSVLDQSSSATIDRRLQVNTVKESDENVEQRDHRNNGKNRLQKNEGEALLEIGQSQIIIVVDSPGRYAYKLLTKATQISRRHCKKKRSCHPDVEDPVEGGEKGQHATIGRYLLPGCFQGCREEWSGE